MKIIAESKSLGKTIECNVEIDKIGHMTTEYPMSFITHHQTNKIVDCIRITKQQALELLNVEIPGEANVPLQNQSEWKTIEKNAAALRDNYRKQQEQADKENIRAKWDKMIADDAILELTAHWNLSTNKVSLRGLPGHLIEKSDFIARKLDHITADETRRIPARQIEEILNAPKQQEKRRIEKLHEVAQKTGKPQKNNSISAEWNSHREHWSENRIATYINPDGSTFTREEKAEPDHY